MAAEKALPFAGTDEELEKYLLEFARLSGGLAGRHATGWMLSAGARLSTNPNTIPWKIRIRRTAEGLELAEEAGGPPWSRAKTARIAAFRKGQVADWLTARVRGSGPEKFDVHRLREPFTAFGSGVASLTGAFTWAVLTSLATLAAAFVSVVVACMPLMKVVIRGIAEHSQILQNAGAIPLPSVEEALSTGMFWPAVVLAVPIAFFAGLVHAASLVACDLGCRAARAPQAAAIFIAILIGAAFWPFLSVAAIPLALLVPAGTHLGATIVWSLRREKIRDYPKPDKKLVLIAVILAASLAGAVVPRAIAWKDAQMRIALFRDGWLLGNAPGRAVAATYYRYTLYTAEPIKEMTARMQPTAACEDPATAAHLRALGYVVVRGGADVVIQRPADLAALKAALAEHSRQSFRGGALKELCSLGWHAVYYAGPLAILVVFMGAFAPLISILFRKLQPRMALFALCALAMGSSLLLVLFQEEAGPAPDPADLAEAMTDARPHKRHEAVVLAWQRESTKEIAAALLKVADDPDFRVRLWACAALGKSGDSPGALDKLVQHLDDPEIHVRYRAAEGLGLLRDPQAEEPLARMLRTRSWYEGLYALEALRALVPGKY